MPLTAQVYIQTQVGHMHDAFTGDGGLEFAPQQSALSNKNHQDGGRAHSELARVPRGEFFIRLRFVDSLGDQLPQLYSSCTRRLAFWWSWFPSIDLPQLPNLRACTACATKRGGIVVCYYTRSSGQPAAGCTHALPWNKARSTRIYVWMLELERVITHARHVSMQPGRRVVFLCLDPSIELIVSC